MIVTRIHAEVSVRSLYIRVSIDKKAIMCSPPNTLRTRHRNKFKRTKRKSEGTLRMGERVGI